MLRITNPFERCIPCIGYHFNDDQKNFVIIRYYLTRTEVKVKIPPYKELHISAKGLKNFPFEIGSSFVTFIVPTSIEQHRSNNYNMFILLLEGFLNRIWFE